MTYNDSQEEPWRLSLKSILIVVAVGIVIIAILLRPEAWPLNSIFSTSSSTGETVIDDDATKDAVIGEGSGEELAGTGETYIQRDRDGDQSAQIHSGDESSAGHGTDAPATSAVNSKDNGDPTAWAIVTQHAEKAAVPDRLGDSLSEGANPTGAKGSPITEPTPFKLGKTETVGILFYSKHFKNGDVPVAEARLEAGFEGKVNPAAIKATPPPAGAAPAPAKATIEAKIGEVYGRKPHKVSPSFELSIQAPRATMAIRGTAIGMRIEEDATFATVYEGKAVIFSPARTRFGVENSPR